MPPEADTLVTPFPIAGVDEVGRGPLAGPVVAAAVVLDPRRPVDGLDDSKRLGEAERERLDALIRRRALAWCVASASVAEIDALNILHASLLAMQRAVAGLAPPGDGGLSPGAPGAPCPPAHVSSSDVRCPPLVPVPRSSGSASLSPGAGRWSGSALASPEWCAERAAASTEEPRDPSAGRPGIAPALVLIDGNRCPELPYPCCAVVQGDSRVRAIAAASILAKVARDASMRAWHEHHPGFGFARHKGYATKEHREALVSLGATALHRRSFAPVRAALATRVVTGDGSPGVVRDADREALRVPGSNTAARHRSAR